MTTRSDTATREAIDTPRTDAVVDQYDPKQVLVGLVRHARQLERELQERTLAAAKTAVANGQLRFELAAATQRAERLEAALRAVVAHWDEFGREYGLDELIDRVARAALRSTTETQP